MSHGIKYVHRIYSCLHHCPHYKGRILHYPHNSFRSLVLKLSQLSRFEPPLGRRAHIYHFLNLVFLFGYNPLYQVDRWRSLWRLVRQQLELISKLTFSLVDPVTMPKCSATPPRSCASSTGPPSTPIFEKVCRSLGDGRSPTLMGTGLPWPRPKQYSLWVREMED